MQWWTIEVHDTGGLSTQINASKTLQRLQLALSPPLRQESRGMNHVEFACRLAQQVEHPHHAAATKDNGKYGVNTAMVFRFDRLSRPLIALMARPTTVPPLNGRRKTGS